MNKRSRRIERTTQRIVKDQYSRLVEVPIKTGISSFDIRCRTLHTGEVCASTQFSRVIPLFRETQWHSDRPGDYTARVIRQFAAFDIPEDVRQFLLEEAKQRTVIAHVFFMKVGLVLRVIGCLAFDVVTADCLLFWVGDPRPELRYDQILQSCRDTLQRAMRRTNWTATASNGKESVSIAVFKQFVRSLGYAVSILPEEKLTYWIHERGRQKYLLTDPPDPSDVCRMRLDAWLASHDVIQPVQSRGTVKFVKVQIV